MSAPQLEGFAEAQKAVDANLSPRFRELDRLDRYVCGTQYVGRPDWWTAVDVPLAEREPCIVYPITRIAIGSFVDLVLGQHRFPSVKVKGAAATKVRKVFRQSRFAAVAREQFAAGLGCGTAVLIVGKREGRPFLDTVPAKWCAPKFLPGTNTVLELEIRYPFIAQEKDAQGKWKAVPKLFRRVIDDKSDTTYKSVPASISGAEPKWIADPDRTFQHDLGYCPVVWWACMRGATIEGRADGHAIHEDLLDEITAHDLALSQRQRAAFMAGDPQWTEIGVDKGYNPSGTGRTMSHPASPEGGAPKPGERAKHRYVAGGTQPARKKGPGNIWQYEDPETKVQLHQLDSGALDAIDKNARDLRLKICDAFAYVPLDPETLPKGAITGKALESLKERQLSRCDYYRDDVTDGWLIPATQMLLRVTEIAADVEIEAIELDWPDYYKPDFEDRQKELTAEVDGTTKTISIVGTPTFARVAKKRLARMLLGNDVSEEDLETIDAEIESGEQDNKSAIVGAEAAQSLDIPSPTLKRHVTTKTALALASGADDATKKKIQQEIEGNVKAENANETPEIAAE